MFTMVACFFFFFNSFGTLQLRATELTLQSGYSLRTFVGHNATVMSLDFHPIKDDLICSCDGDGEIRYWSINNGSYAKVFKVNFVDWGFRSLSGLVSVL